MPALKMQSALSPRALLWLYFRVTCALQRWFTAGYTELSLLWIGCPAMPPEGSSHGRVRLGVTNCSATLCIQVRGKRAWKVLTKVYLTKNSCSLFLATATASVLSLLNANTNLVLQMKKAVLLKI